MLFRYISDVVDKRFKMYVVESANTDEGRLLEVETLFDVAEQVLQAGVRKAGPGRRVPADGDYRLNDVGSCHSCSVEQRHQVRRALVTVLAGLVCYRGMEQ